MKLIITEYEGSEHCQDDECDSEPIYQLENPYHGLIIYSCVDCIGEAIDFEYQNNFEDGKE